MLEIETPVYSEVTKIIRQLRAKKEFEDKHWFLHSVKNLVGVVDMVPTAIGRSEFVASPVQWLSLLENLDKLELCVLEQGFPWRLHPSFEQTLKEDPEEALRMQNFKWGNVANIEARATLYSSLILPDQGIVELYVSHDNGTEISYKLKKDGQYHFSIAGGNQFYQTPFNPEKSIQEMPLNEYQIVDYYLKAFLFE